MRGLERGEFYSTEEELERESPEGDRKLREFISTKVEEFVKRYHQYFEENNERVGHRCVCVCMCVCVCVCVCTCMCGPR